MKVIDLLNKIANGEKVPEKIIYNGKTYYNVGNEEDIEYKLLEREEVQTLLKEIERLNKDNGDITKLFAKEREETKRLHSIIKEVREYIEENKHSDMYYVSDFEDTKIYKNLSLILDKVEENK